MGCIPFPTAQLRLDHIKHMIYIDISSAPITNRNRFGIILHVLKIVVLVRRDIEVAAPPIFSQCHV